MVLHKVLFYLTILLLPTQLGFHTWPDWAFVLGRRIDYLSPTLFVTDITIILMTLAWIYTKKIVPLKRNVVVIVGLILMSLGLTIVVSNEPILSLYKWIKILEYGVFMYYIVKTKPTINHIVLALSVGALYSSLIAMTQFFLQKTINGPLWFLGERSFDQTTPGIAKAQWCWFTTRLCEERIRPYATFPHPNVLGGYLATSIVLILSTIKKTAATHIKQFFVIVISISTIALMLTLSRSAWMIAVLGSGTLLYINWKHFSKKQHIGLVIMLLVMAGITLPYLVVLNTSHESVFLRYDLMVSALQIFLKHPMFGSGLGTFLVHLPSVAQTRDLFFLQPVHNIYLLWLAETGIVGTIVVVYLFIRYIKIIFHHHTSCIFTLPLLLLLFVGLVDHYPLTIQQGQLLLSLVFTLPFLQVRHS